MNITDPIREHAQRTPGQVAYVGQPNRMQVSYAALDRLIDAAALRVLEAGVRPGQTAIVGLNEVFPYIVTMLALARIGVAAGATSLPDRFADVRLVSAATAGSTLREVVASPDWFAIGAATPAAARPPSAQGGAATWAIFGTSGTTGTPRHFAISHAMLARRLAIAARTTPTPAAPRQLVRVGLRTSYGCLRLLSVLGAGGLVAFPADHEIATSLRVRSINMLVMAPADIARFLRSLPADAPPFPALASVVLSGSIVPRPLYEEVRDRLCPNVVANYGATEIGPIAGGALSDLIETPGCVGYVDKECEVQCVDEDDRPVAPGSSGIVRVRRNPDSGTYIDDPEASARTFRGDWFYPGDVGLITHEGRLVIAGRQDEMVNVGGDKLSPRVIEERVRALGNVVDAAVFTVPNARGIPEVWVAVVPGPSLDVGAFATRCAEAKAVPLGTRFLSVPEVPRNPAGKVLRDDLVRMVVARRGG